MCVMLVVVLQCLPINIFFEERVNLNEFIKLLHFQKVKFQQKRKILAKINSIIGEAYNSVSNERDNLKQET